MDLIKALKEEHHIVLTDQQYQAMGHKEGPALVLAVPGSGKTTLLLSRTADLILNGGVTADEILSVTFSRPSANDMKARFAKLFAFTGIGEVKFSTIHSLAYGIVMSYGKSTHQHYRLIEGRTNGGPSKNKILREIYRGINRTYLSEGEYEVLVTAISYVKNNMSLKTQIKEVATSLADDHINRFEEVLDQYEALKGDNHWIDFDDMLVICYQILEERRDIRSIYQKKYQYIQVDEAQDTSIVQHKILNLLVNEGENIFYVADDDQSIYGFRGASPDYLLNIEKTYDQRVIYKLEENFRSTESLVKVSNAFIKMNTNRYNKEMRTNNAPGPEIAIMGESTLEDHYKFIVACIVRSGSYQDHAILYRNNQSAIIAAEQLYEEDIPFYIKGHNNRFFEHWIVKDVFDLLTFALDPTSADEFLSIYYKLQGYYISRKMVDAIIGAEWNKPVFRRLITYNKLDKRQANNVLDLEDDFNRLRTLKPYGAINYLLDHMGYRAYLEDRGVSVTGYSNSTGQILTTLLKLSEKTNDLNDFKERLATLRDVMKASGRNENQEVVTLTTIHGAKGLEWENVYMIDLVNGLFPSGRLSKGDDPSSMEEERRVYYVGMTRAKRRLSLLGTAGDAIFLDETIKIINDQGAKNKDEMLVDGQTESEGTLDQLMDRYSLAGKMAGISVGVVLQHKAFGQGVVIDYAYPSMLVDFDGAQRKMNYEFCLKQGLIEF